MIYVGIVNCPGNPASKALDLSHPEELASFVDWLNKIMETAGKEIALIVFDTLARSIGPLDENCLAFMTEGVKHAGWIARELDAHVTLVHHTGKAPHRGGRGSSALRAEVDTQMCLTKVKDENCLCGPGQAAHPPKLTPERLVQTRNGRAVPHPVRVTRHAHRMRNASEPAQALQRKVASRHQKQAANN